jgi:hypothetical protein
MQTDDVTSAQKVLELDLFDRHPIGPDDMALETEHMAAKGISETGDL